MIKTKEMILNYLENEDFSLEDPAFKRYTTLEIAQKLNISRSLCSQYLNELVSEGFLIKIVGRPVLFLCKKLLEKKYSVIFESPEYLSVGELKKELNCNENKKEAFHKAVGFEGSLKYPINQVKSALLYPPRGLPILLYGGKGSGKYFIVKLAFEFAKDQKMIPGDSCLIKTTALRYKDNGTDFSNQLFGIKRDGQVKPGLIESARNGIVYIEDADVLNKSCIERLIDYTRTGAFSRIGQAEKVYSSTRIIFSITAEFQDELLLQNDIPIKCYIPRLDERYSEEKEELILKYFGQEGSLIKKPVYISKQLFDVLMNYSFKNNIAELKNCIKTICANAYLKNSKDDKLEIYTYYLPDEYLHKMQLDLKANYREEELIPVNENRNNHREAEMLSLFDKVLAYYDDFVKKKSTFWEFCEYSLEVMRKYYDYLSSNENCRKGKVHSIEKLIHDSISGIKDIYDINLPLNCSLILSRMIYNLHMAESTVLFWQRKRNDTINSCLNLLKEMMPGEYACSSKIADCIKGNLDIQLDWMDFILLILNLHFYNKDLTNQDTIGIVICHGHSTASSIADAVNQLIGKRIFEAIDMPLSTSAAEMQRLVESYILSHGYYRNIILMVDMGSLEDIGNNIQILNEMQIGVINHISTSMALNIGNKIIQNQELETILSEVCEEEIYNYKILKSKKKQDAIIFTSDAGIEVSRKILGLFVNSLLKKIDVNFIEYDFNQLQRNGVNDKIFKNYNVRMLVKPYALQIDKVCTVSLEDMINSEGVEKVNQILRQYLNEQEIKSFNERFIKNFSLESVMESITILNPVILLEHVSEALNNLQNAMKVDFTNKTLVGLYIHTCLLLERLVTKSEIQILDKTKRRSFEKNHGDFIECILKSFKDMMKNYNVKLPIDEMIYIYDYIQNDENYMVKNS